MRKIGGPEIKKSVLVDASNLLHRAYYAHEIKPYLPITKIAIDLVHSYLDSIGRSYEPYMVFDGHSDWRRELHPGYKGGRKQLGVSLREDSSQFSLSYFKQWCLDNNISIIHSASDEADDCIASFVRNHSEEQIVICSDDKDFYVLLTHPRLVIYRPGVDPKDRFVDREKAEESIKKSYNLPEFNIAGMRWFKSLTGDKSDNITGVFRLPKKLASRVASFNDLDEGVRHIEDKWKDKILEIRHVVESNYKIVGFKEDLDYKNYLIRSRGVKKLYEVLPQEDWLKDI